MQRSWKREKYLSILQFVTERLYLECRTRLVGILIVAINLSFLETIELKKRIDETHKGFLLLRSACVFAGVLTSSVLCRLASADIDDADRVRVMVGDMSTNLVYVTTEVDRSVAVDDVVVADIAPATSTCRDRLCVPAADGVNGIVLALRSGRAMEEERVDATG